MADFICSLPGFLLPGEGGVNAKIDSTGRKGSFPEIIERLDAGDG